MPSHETFRRIHEQDRDSEADRRMGLRHPVAIVVDHDTRVIRTLGSILHQEFSVLGAATVAEGKCWLRAAPRVDLAFVDDQLPDGPGSDVLAELCRRHPRSARVLMSSWGRGQRRSPELDSAHVLLDKPLDLRLVRSVWAAAISLDY